MRVLLVGTDRERARLRARLGASVEIVGEFATLAEARASRLAVDGVLVAPPAEPSPEDAPAEIEALTPRERQVLDLVAEGLPNKVIAARLGISDQTVKFHLASIVSKLGASNRTEAVHVALRRGLITL